MGWTIQKFIDAKHILIPTSSYNQNFEWFNTLVDFEKKYLFSKMWVKDPFAAYWQLFDEKNGFGPHALALYIKDKIAESKAEKSLIMGLSMGGYGAILLGCLCEADVVIAISPQTQIVQYRKEKYKLREKWLNSCINEEELDLKNILGKYDTGKTIYKLFYGENQHYDTEESERISFFSNVKLFPQPSYRHSMERIILKKILQEHITNFLET